MIKLIYIGCRFTYMGYTWATFKPNSMDLQREYVGEVRLGILRHQDADDHGSAGQGYSHMSQTIAK